ncbi:MAG: hypothetical protein AB1758_33130 [Candidatus Eremiobacterota bacterium]
MSTPSGPWYIGARRGFSLAETLVVAAMFLAILVSAVALERSSRAARAKGLVQRDAFRAALLGLEQIRRELEGALVDPVPLDGLSLSYRPPRYRNGLPEFSPSGEVEYAEPATLRMEPDGRLVRQDPAGVRTLAWLGNRGELRFTPLPDRTDEVQVDLRARQVDPGGQVQRQSDYSLSVRLRLNNQF